jgi:UDP-N-acetylmuramate--alanine ligase
LENHNNSFDVLKKNFLEFINNLPFYGLCLINANDINSKSIIGQISRPFKTFGFETEADYVASSIDFSSIPSSYIYKEDGNDYEIKVSLPGKHNAINSLAALAVSRELGVSIDIIQKALMNFPGISRRFEIIGNFYIDEKKFTWIDDYGHHPSEMKEVIDTILNVWNKKRVVMVFQPHRYSRTSEHFNQFVDVLKKINNIILMDIYPANERPIDNINSTAILQEINKDFKRAVLINDKEELSAYLMKNIKNDDILLTMGAGDISKFVNYFKDFINR